MMTVSAPILLRTLKAVKQSIDDDRQDILSGSLMKEVGELVRQIEDEVLTPRWTRLVNAEVGKMFEAKPKLVEEGGK